MLKLVELNLLGCFLQTWLLLRQEKVTLKLSASTVMFTLDNSYIMG